MSDRDEGRLGETVAETIPLRAARVSLDANDTIGRYRLIAKLGEGAMGVVWSALDPTLDRTVALKVVHPTLSSPESAERMLREARALAKVSHPAVVTVYDAAEIDARLFIAMEMIEGTTLGAMLRDRTAAEAGDWRRWLALLLDAGRGLAAAHRAGILHRDFKPDNVLVDSEGRPRVADFGLASLSAIPAKRASHRDVAPSVELTATGALLGTPLYMPPQQLFGEAIDARADQFAFCVTCWEAVYGVRPFAVETTGWGAVAELATKINTGALVDPATTTAPPELRELLLRGLRANPAERHADMDGLVGKLAALLAPVAATRVRWLATAGVVAMVAAVSIWALRSATPPRAVARRLFPVAIWTQLALSPDGRHLALGGDRIEVRDLPLTASPTTALPTLELGARDQIDRFELDATGVLFSNITVGPTLRWDYATSAGPTRITVPDGVWQARLDDVDVVTRSSGTQLRLVAVRGDHELASWPLATQPAVVAVSPDNKRLALIEATRFGGTIEIVDVSTHELIQSRTLVEPTAVTWVTPTELLYATGALIDPTIWRVELTATGFGPGEPVYRKDRGWFTRLVARGEQVFFIEASPSTRTRMLNRGATSTVRDFDATTVAAPIGWEASGAFIAWNQIGHSLERHGATTSPFTTSAFDDEPVNATVADDIVIVAKRANGGRVVEAISLTTGAPVWSNSNGDWLAVRCAGDRTAPCYALRAAREPHDEIFKIDPHSGAVLGAPMSVGDDIEDIAIRADGQLIAIAGPGSRLRQIDPMGIEGPLLQTDLGHLRSVAYDPTGGVLIAGTRRGNTFELGRDDGTEYKPITTSDSELLSLVRPSNDGATILVLARTLSPALWQLDL